MFKWLRIFLLLFVLASVWVTLVNQKKHLADWQGTTDIVIIPINADSKSQAYIDTLSLKTFTDVSRYVDKQIKRYLPNKKHAIDISLGAQINSLPPSPPQNRNSKFDVALWSLKLRWWMWRNEPDNHHSQQIRLYVLYSSPDKNVLLPHSLAVQKGLVGMIYARAYNYAKNFNNVVITHELMHVFGATDKYDLTTGLAIYPQGYADPNIAKHKFQRRAALMGRTFPSTTGNHKVAEHLKQTIINPITAKEVGWIK